MAQSIRDVMTTEPVTLPAGATVRQAAQAMDEADIGNVIVMNEANEVGGIVTDRDITIRVVAEGLEWVGEGAAARGTYYVFRRPI